MPNSSEEQKKMCSDPKPEIRRSQTEKAKQGIERENNLQTISILVSVQVVHVTDLL